MIAQLKGFKTLELIHYQNKFQSSPTPLKEILLLQCYIPNLITCGGVL